MFEIDEYCDDTDFVEEILLLVDERRDDTDDTEAHDLCPLDLLILDFTDFWPLDCLDVEVRREDDDLCDLTETEDCDIFLSIRSKPSCNDSPPLLDEVDDLIDFLSELCDFVSNE